MSFVRFSILLSAVLLFPVRPAAAAPAAEDPVGVTLQRVKSAYHDRKYAQAEEALRNVAELIAAPEREAVRPKVLPALHFYSAAVAYAVKDEDRARASLRRFFELNPDATIDPAAYPKSFRIFFDAQRTEAARQAALTPGAEAIAGGVLPNYATQDLEAAAIPPNTGAADWNEGPVKFLMDPSEEKVYRTRSDDDARRAFVEDFWRRRDPNPETADNEFEDEFYRRVQYADRNFSTESIRGALSDRGMVFLLLGPPSYVGRAVIRPGQDIMDVLRTSEAVGVPTAGGGRAFIRVPSNRVSISAGTTEGDVETWYYRRDRVMKGLPFSELQYQFVSRRGYGTSVLQKDPVPLTALRQAAKLLQRHRG